MLKIRLSRGGAKKRPYYSIVIADSHSPRDGRFIEKVGAYNPLLKKDDPQRLVLKTERVTEWLSKGAQPTERVARFLAMRELRAWEHGTNLKKGEPHAKAKGRVKERDDRATAQAAAAAEAAEAATAAAAEAAAHPTEEAAAEVVVEQAIGFPEATVEDADADAGAGAGAGRTEPATEA